MKILLTAFLTLACSAFAQLDTVTFGWEPSNPVTVPVREYNLYFSKSTNVWTHVKPAGLNTQATVQLDSVGRWYFVAVATGTNGMNSLPSNMVAYDVSESTSSPNGLKVISAVVTRIETIVKAPNLITVP